MATGKYAQWLEPDGLLRLEAWARDGLTLEQIAHNCGCNAKTLCDWRKRYPPICNALKKGRDVADIEVENALRKRALGYSYIETTSETVKDPDTGQEELRVTKTVTKEVAPDVTAQIFWLKNRRATSWRDKQREDVEGLRQAIDRVGELMGKLDADAQAK